MTAVRGVKQQILPGPCPVANRSGPRSSLDNDATGDWGCSRWQSCTEEMIGDRTRDGSAAAGHFLGDRLRSGGTRPPQPPMSAKYRRNFLGRRLKSLQSSHQITLFFD